MTTDFYNLVLQQARTEQDWVTLRHLFKNYRNGEGLNLTKLGLNSLKAMGIEYEIFKAEKEIKFTGKFRVLLDRYNKYPYYIDRNYLVLFGTEDRIMFKLYGKDLEAWMEHMEHNLQ
jgi:hypothetical protein|tara:strand:- start:17467 stop:17817 length:351 start_codon:yes stop_codon:yes gene_type:complete